MVNCLEKSPEGCRFSKLGLSSAPALLHHPHGEEGVPLQVTQALVGHTTEAVTARYTHISEKARRAAVEKLEATRKVPHSVDVFVGVQESDATKSFN